MTTKSIKRFYRAKYRKSLYERQSRAERRAALKMLPYEEYIKTDHWMAVQAEALRRAVNKCQLCRSQKGLQVHHNTYDNIGREKPSDLIVLCKDCHYRFHDKLG